MYPASATDEELLQSQTLKLDVSGRLWTKRPQLTLQPILIAPYWWFWWLRWCREFVIRGRVVCPDGDPVPGAEVCAFDVDWWFLWSSTQQVGCATTDINGAFEIRFRWCCGWWPWWWWNQRVWALDEVLGERVEAALAVRPDLEIGQVGHRPALTALAGLLKDEDIATDRPLEAADAARLESIRSRLVAKLPASDELTRLHVWPWWPWWPWWDCTPDIIFKVRQACEKGGLTTVVGETVWDTRWDISSPLDVTLVTNDEACCLPAHDPDDCFVVDAVCGVPLASVGGDAGAPATPVGFAYPGAVVAGTATYNGDRPSAAPSRSARTRATWSASITSSSSATSAARHGSRYRRRPPPPPPVMQLRLSAARPMSRCRCRTARARCNRRRPCRPGSC